MSDVQLALRQVWYINKAFVRNPASAFFTLVFPLMFLVIFSVIFGNGTIQVARDVTVNVATFYVPAISAFSVITACYTNIAISLSFARDSGGLKRIRGSPLPVWAYMFARISHAVLIAVLLVAICAAFGAIFYHATLPTATLPAFVLAVIVGAASFSALGVAVTCVIPNADAAPAVVNASILPLLFISNVFIPLRNPPQWLDLAGKIFPVRHFADSLVSSFFALSGSGLQTNDLLVIGAWGVAGMIIAIRFFDWEPRV
ncbi:MAG TPA: ABC transporter permease [Candidatus Dormibacteraeota bacterium]|jgi:ABC-2 type transport system permease protein|nr:ABC transporter permease [Candidatus Dormibacteraeota bacterium]